ncbi:MAG: hypothetical protein A4S15_11850 [Candidatus Raskinella chloraquaticus]|uniref:DUF4124 domain-containing protein n=2 Tax=Candidatus Raskinella chloraquaticus TaxID=1951219 RepID=A0A1W9HV12_9HYPH|nr:MAG: hypothetical protein A4S15_11850 [Proteobacteria bacterium SG_bin8]
MSIRSGLLAMIFAVFSGIVMARHASASDGQIVWFWENGRTFGWSIVPDSQYGNRPPPPVTSKMSVTERCGRLVGRQMLRDRPGRVNSTQLEDACVRNGGQL